RQLASTNSLELPQVEKIVCGVQPANVLEAFLPTLAVKPDSHQILRTEVLPQAHVCAAEHSELIHGVPDVDLCVTKSSGAEVLVVADNLRAIVRKDHAQPEPADEFRIREMCHDVSNRPLAR